MAYIQYRYLNPSQPQQSAFDVLPQRAPLAALPDFGGFFDILKGAAWLGGGLLAGYTVGWLWRELRTPAATNRGRRRRRRNAKLKFFVHVAPDYSKIGIVDTGKKRYARSFGWGQVTPRDVESVWKSDRRSFQPQEAVLAAARRKDEGLRAYEALKRKYTQEGMDYYEAANRAEAELIAQGVLDKPE